MNNVTTVVREFEALRKSGTLPVNTQKRADDISRNLYLANQFGGERYFETVERARSFVALCRELGMA